MVSETILADGLLIAISFLVIKFILWNKIIDFLYLVFVNKWTFWAIIICFIAGLIEPSLIGYYEKLLFWFIDGFKSVWVFIEDLVVEMLFNN